MYRRPKSPVQTTVRTGFFACFVCLVTALAPAELYAEAPSKAIALRRTDPSTGDNTLRRLIVKYKDDVRTRVEEPWRPIPRIPTGKERATDLNAASYRREGGRRALRLSHLKSITEQSHVMVSDTPLTRTEMKALTQKIAQDPRVEYAEIDERAYPLTVPDAPAAGQWSLKADTDEPGGTNVPNAWNLFAGAPQLNGTGVTVAVVDTGYRPHIDLAANIVQGYDFVSMDTDGSYLTANDGDGRDADAQDPGDWNPTTRGAPEPCDAANSTWHGTRVAGIIGAVGNNGVGIIGIAYGATLLPVRVLGRCGGYVSDIAAGIQWAAGLPIPGTPANSHPAKVINVSIGSEGACGTTFQQAITAARNAGSVIVVATGNQGNTTIDSPANCSGVIAVTAHTRLGDNADYANIGVGTHISAPGGGFGSNSIPGDGGSVYSTSNTGSTIPVADSYAADSNGTSFAAPHVAGVAALLFQIRPTISPDAVLTYLQSNARAYLPGTYCNGRTDCGSGMLDAFAAVAALQTAQGTPNNVPLLNAMSAQTVAAGGSLQFTATATDADGDRVTYSIVGLPAGASFDGNSGVFTWGYALPGLYTVTIFPFDGAAFGTASTVRITVTGSLPSGGGGGGATNPVDVLAMLLLFFTRWALGRRSRNKTSA